MKQLTKSQQLLLKKIDSSFKNVSLHLEQFEKENRELHKGSIHSAIREMIALHFSAKTPNKERQQRSRLKRKFGIPSRNAGKGVTRSTYLRNSMIYWLLYGKKTVFGSTFKKSKPFFSHKSAALTVFQWLEAAGMERPLDGKKLDDRIDQYLKSFNLHHPQQASNHVLGEGFSSKLGGPLIKKLPIKSPKLRPQNVQ